MADILSQIDLPDPLNSRFHSSTQVRMTPYDGKNTKTPAGTAFATLTVQELRKIKLKRALSTNILVLQDPTDTFYCRDF
jgi:hypothetical protein